MTGVLIKEENLDTGRMPCEHEGRDQSDGSTGRGTPKIAHKPPKAWNRFALTAHRRN